MGAAPILRRPVRPPAGKPPLNQIVRPSRGRPVSRGSRPVDSHAPDAAPAALNDLIAAGLVSHEVIGDPGANTAIGFEP